MNDLKFDIKVWMTWQRLNPNPSKSTKAMRFVGHWLSIPVKLLYNMILGSVQIIKNNYFTKNRVVPAKPTPETKKDFFKYIMSRLPVWKNELNGFQTYVPRVSLYEQPQGWNHSDLNQLSRHGIYAFLMGKIGQRSAEIDVGLTKHVQHTRLSRGYKLNPYEGQIQHNMQSVSGKELLAFTLAMTTMKKEILQGDKGVAVLKDLSIGYLKERYDEVLSHVVDNDHSFLEGAEPSDRFACYIWREQMKVNDKLIVKKTLKSSKGVLTPRAAMTGTDALTLLAAVRVGDKILGASYAKKEYRKLLYHYGLGLLSLFPTAFSSNRANYFSNSQCMNALYVLSKLADTKSGKLFWKIPMLFVWLQSRKWYNAYFTGLLEESYPETVSPEYISACESFLYEEKPSHFSYSDSGLVKPKEYPPKFNDINQYEFSCENEPLHLLPFDITPDDKYQVMRGLDRYRSGLGWIAGAIMIDKNAKGLLE